MYLPTQSKLKRGSPLHRVDAKEFRSLMEQQQPPYVEPTPTNIDAHVTQLNEVINNAAKQARNPRPAQQWDPQEGRWIRLLQSGDDRAIWRAIGWNGCLVKETQGSSPSDEEFKTHFETLLYTRQEELSINIDDAPYIPALDDPFTPNEVEHGIRNAKDKAFTGACVGLFRWLPLQWIIYFTQLLNIIFSSAQYPTAWCFNTLIVLFKSGERMICGNYRGISIMDSASKIYDELLNSRLSKWMNIDKAQAGAQKHRGCIEQILTLRLLVEYAKKHKQKLFLLFVDFQKAYDKVPRQKLLQCLKARGCGKMMLLALRALYRCTQFVLQSATITANTGVRQGAPTSCTLFVMYIDNLVRMMKDGHMDDGFLGALHVLLLMDDAVILATSRAQCIDKLSTLHAFCSEYGMRMNMKKTKLMVINGDNVDREPLRSADTDEAIMYTKHYVYLGAHFLDDGKMGSVMKKQAESCIKHVNKFSSFVQKNANMPFSLKKMVLRAALFSAILYSCETWLYENISSVNKHYMAAVKLLLGVRTTTPHILCLIEAGLPELQSTIQKRQGNFFRSFTQKSTGEEPLAHALRLCNGMQMLNKLQNAAARVNAGDPEAESMQHMQEECRRRAPDSTRLATYLSINPTLYVHPAYVADHDVPDTVRISLSRMRLSSHRLKVETGRWLRLAREERVCSCDGASLQDEHHVILRCPMTETVRNLYYDSVTSLPAFFEIETKLLCKICHEILRLYSN